MGKSQTIKILEQLIAKTEASDPQVKYDVLYTGIKRFLRELRSTPIENWKNGKLNNE